MKIYINILGIVSFLFCLVLFGFWLYQLVDFLNDENDDLWVLLLISIPLYAMIHFLIFHRLGFNFSTEFTRSQRNIVVALSIVFNAFLFILFSIFFNNKHIENEKIKNLAEPLSLGIDTAAYGYSAELITRFLDDKINYQFKTLSEDPFKMGEISLPVFVIEFYDKDGFFIDQIEIKDYTRKVDSLGNLRGISANSSSYMYHEDYKRIAKWSLLVSRPK